MKSQFASTVLASRRAHRLLTPLRDRIVPRADRVAIARFGRLARRRSAASDATLVRETTLRAFSAYVADVTRGQRRDEALETAVCRAFAQLAKAHVADRRKSTLVRRTAVDAFHRLYYHTSTRTWKDTYFRGVQVLKNPLDLWLYQEILTEVRPDLIVETGTRYGGSAYYLANLCDLLGTGRVVTIDVEVLPDRPQHPRITYLTGSSTDPDIAGEVRRLSDGAERVLVVLDSDHRHAHVLDELRTLHPLVSVGSYLIVEDTNVNGHPVYETFGPGPMEALNDFLAENDAFEVDETKHKFYFTFNPRGYLKRVR